MSDRDQIWRTCSNCGRTYEIPPNHIIGSSLCPSCNRPGSGQPTHPRAVGKSYPSDAFESLLRHLDHRRSVNVARCYGALVGAIVCGVTSWIVSVRYFDDSLKHVAGFTWLTGAELGAVAGALSGALVGAILAGIIKRATG